MRSACTSRFHFFADSPATETAVRWYRVPKDRPALGLTTQFCSSIWDDGRESVPLGEIASTRQWWAGGPEDRVPVGAPGRCGTPQQWAEGVLIADPLPPVDPITGQCFCCGTTAFLARGGIAEGGNAEQPGVQLAMGIGLQAQVCWHAWQELPLAIALDGQPNPPQVVAALALGIALGAIQAPPPHPAKLPLGLALAAAIHPAIIAAELPLGLAGVAVVTTPVLVSAELPLGLAGDAVVINPPPVLADWPLALALTATVATPVTAFDQALALALSSFTTGPNGPPTPGTTCALAALFAVPHYQNRAIGAGQNHWYKFIMPASGTVTVKFLTWATNGFWCKVFGAPCANEPPFANLMESGPTTLAIVGAPGSTMLMRVFVGGGGASNYTYSVT